jgi:phage tail-like protein
MVTPTSWWKRFNFLVEIDGITRAAFVTCSGLEMEIENVAYTEGDMLHPHNAPGTAKFTELTLARGACNDWELYNLWKAAYDAASGTGQDDPDCYVDMDIVQLDRMKNELCRWRVSNAYCRVFKTGNWDKNANEVRMEEVTFTIEYAEPQPA